MRAASRSPFALGLGLILLAGFLLRIWGVRTGLPFVFNVDEGAHFVPRAIGMFDHSYNPAYFINPPAFTYLLHGAFWLRWGGDAVREQFAADPTPVWTLARVFSALLGTAAAGLLAWAAVRLFDRRVALYVIGRFAIFKQAYTNELDPATIQLPPAGWRPVARTADYAAYARC